MAGTNIYMTFNGNAREAMQYYKECLGGDLRIQEVAGSPMEKDCPPHMQDKVLHASLVTNGIVLMGSDMVAPGGFVKGNNMSISVNCDSAEQLTDWFNRLSTDGHVIDPLGKKFWGALFGVTDDKYGIRWMLNYEG